MAVPAEEFPQHPRPWTLEEVLALPEDSGQRVELIDGAVVMSPAPAPTHQRILHRLQLALDGDVPAGMELLPGVNVVLNGGRLLIPDLVVTTSPGHTDVYFTGDQVLLAIEIMSPSSAVYDRVLKRQLYAEAGVQFFVIVDSKPAVPEVVLYELSGGDYEEIARSREGELRMHRPFPATIELTGKRRQVST